MTITDPITSREAAAILGVERSTLVRWSNGQRWAGARQVRFERLASGAKLYSRADVEQLRDQLAKQAS